MILFYDFLSYITSILNEVVNLIFSSWITSVMFGFSVLYLIVNAIKLKRNTE